jgi:chaperonin GroEL (HSP60 family)
MIQDIAFTRRRGHQGTWAFKLENVEVSQLGQAKRVVVTMDNTTIIEGAA